MLLLLLALSGPPLVTVFLTSLQKDVLTRNAHWSLENFGLVLQEFGGAGPISNTLIFSLGSALLALFLGASLALVTERTNTPFRRLCYFTAITVVAIPGPVYAFAWTLIFGKQGPLNVGLKLLFARFGSEFEPISIYNLFGMILVEGLNFSALAFFLLVGPVRAMNRSLEEAAAMSGAGSLQILARITGPLMLPAVLAVLLLTFIRAIEAFAVPAIVGAPGNISVLTTEIYYAVTQRQPPNYGLAAAHGVALVVLVVVLLWVYGRATRHASRFATITGKAFKSSVVEFGWQRYLLSGGVIAFFTIMVLLPLAALMFASIQSYYGGMYYGALTLDNYRDVFASHQIVQAFWNSLIMGAAAGIFIMAITVVAAWLSIRGTGRVRHLLDFAASLPLALPGTVLGLALLTIFVRLPLPIYGTLMAVVIASTIRFMPYGFRYAHSGLLQVHPELEEAGLMSGASRWQVNMRIIAPLLMLPLLSGFIYVFLISARELEAAALLVTSRNPVIAPLLVDLYHNGAIPLLAAFSSVLIVAYGIVAFFFYIIGRRYGIQV